MTDFTKGDRVRIIAQHSPDNLGFVGMTGVVERTLLGGDVLIVPDTERPDGHGRSEFWWPPAMLEKIVEPEPEPEPVNDHIAELERQLAAAQEEARRANYRASSAEESINELKRAVAVKVRDMAKEHGWCHVVKDGLREVGIEPINDRWRITFLSEQTITREWVITANCNGTSEPDVNYVTQSLGWDSISDEPTLDGDWDELDVEEDTYANSTSDPSFDGVSIEEAEE